MKRIIAPSVAVVMLLTAILGCGTSGGSESITERIDADDGGSITSSDGMLTLEIPAGALAEDTRITIQEVDAGDMPDGFADLGEGMGYELTPEGLTFAEPVTVSLTHDPASLEVEGGDGYEIYSLLSWSEEFGFEPLEELVLEISPSEGVATLRGELGHFSYITSSKSGMAVSLEEVDREQPVGGSFTAHVLIENIESILEYPTLVAAYLDNINGQFISSAQVRLVGSGAFTAPHALGMNFEPFRHDGNFRCATTPGEGEYIVRVGAVMTFVWDEGSENLRWHDHAIQIIVSSLIECVAPLPATQVPVTPEDFVEYTLRKMGYTPEQITAFLG